MKKEKVKKKLKNIRLNEVKRFKGNLLFGCSPRFASLRRMQQSGATTGWFVGWDSR